MKEVIVRSISGLLFIIIMVAALLGGVLWYSLLFGAIMVIMMLEYFRITIPKGALKWQKGASLAVAIALFAAVLLTGYGILEAKYLLIPALMPLLIFIGNLYTKSFNRHTFTEQGAREPNGYENFPATLGALLYIALPVSLFSMAALFPMNALFPMDALFPMEALFHMEAPVEFRGGILLGFFIILWASDVGAYCFGCTMGRMGPRLFPSVSPKKSWIGSIGGTACAIGAAALIHSFTELFPFSLADSLIIGALISIGGGFGDLVESQLKRNFGVKDSGSIMPGHGGMLDRFDGALIGFPMAIIYLEFFLK